jgi:hypothetical protein
MSAIAAISLVATWLVATWVATSGSFESGSGATVVRTKRTPLDFSTTLDPYEIRLDCLEYIPTINSQGELANACFNNVMHGKGRKGGREPMASRDWSQVDDTRAAYYYEKEVESMLNVTVKSSLTSLFSEILLNPEPSPPIIDVTRPDRPHHAARAPFPTHLLHPSLQKDLAPYWEHGISLASIGGAMNRLYNSINDYPFGRVVPFAIVDGYPVYQDRAMSQTAKANRLHKQLESVMWQLRHQNRSVPNVLLMQVIDSIPPGPFFHPPMVHLHVPPELRSRPDIVPLVPVLTIAASRSGQTPSAIRVPNMYFGDVRDWAAKVASVNESCFSRPLESRAPQVMWRGDSFSRSSAAFHHARNQALIVQAEAAAENLTDIRLVQRTKECLGARLTIRRWQAHGLLDDETADRMVATPCGEDLFVRHEEFCAYRYLLNLPGSSAGSYSRNLQSLFTMGSVVLHWDNDAVEWYYERLRHNEHYMVVDADSLLPTVRALNANPTRAAALARGGRAAFQRELSPDALLSFYEQLFHAFAALQRFEVDEGIIVDGACACHGLGKGQALRGRVKKCKHAC